MARSKLSFATFNIKNLQIPDTPMYRGNTYSEAEYEAKIDWTAWALKKLNADVIGFQELWHPDALKAAFERAGLNDKYQLAAKNFGNSIGCALAVKKPHKLISKKWVSEFPKELVLKKRKPKADSNVPDYKISVSADYFSRAVLRAKIQPVHGQKSVPEIVVFNAHFKSKLGIYLDQEESRKPTIKIHQAAIGSALSNIRRTAEAAALRIMVSKESKDTDVPVVVMGDLNDNQLSVINSILSQDPSFRLQVGSRAGLKSDTGLYPVAALQEYRSMRDVYYTHVYKDKRESLDHILVSQEFYDHSKKRVWAFKEMQIINDHLNDHSDKSVSDHAPVKAIFEYYPAK